MTLTTEFDKAAGSIRRWSEDVAQGYWDRLPRHEIIDVDEFVDGLLPYTRAAHTQVDALTRGYLSQMSRELGWGEPGAPTPLDVINAPRGVDPREVLARPLREVRIALSEGKTVDEAFDIGRARLKSIVGTDIALVRRAATLNAWTTARGYRPKQDAYRRRLSGPYNCLLCMRAATRVYYVEKLMPIHPGCDCKAVPLPRSRAKRERIMRRVDEELYDAELALEKVDANLSDDMRSRQIVQRTKDGFAVAVKDGVRVREHGEFGPVLTWENHYFSQPRIG